LATVPEGSPEGQSSALCCSAASPPVLGKQAPVPRGFPRGSPFPQPATVPEGPSHPVNQKLPLTLECINGNFSLFKFITCYCVFAAMCE
ncbi:MAG: hypothetical protein KBT13_03525, partial [Bacteroidales bacterium]|nr:hypothetical protein [Candidatus Sodaliphilus limicaballi]